MEKSPLRGNNSKSIALNQIIAGANKRNTTGSGSGASVTYQSVNKKVNFIFKTKTTKTDMIRKWSMNEWQNRSEFRLPVELGSRNAYDVSNCIGGKLGGGRRSVLTKKLLNLCGKKTPYIFRWAGKNLFRRMEEQQRKFHAIFSIDFHRCENQGVSPRKMIRDTLNFSQLHI